MGIKSTVTLSRDAAIEKYIDLSLPSARRQLRAQATLLSNKRLEDVLEVLNDACEGGEGFDNYIVTGRED